MAIYMRMTYTLHSAHLSNHPASYEHTESVSVQNFDNINYKSFCRSLQVLSRVHSRCYKLSISHFLKQCDTRTNLAKPAQPVVNGKASCCLQHSVPLPTETF